MIVGENAGDPVAAVYLGDEGGDFQFTEVVDPGVTGVAAAATSLGDINGDGTLDLVVAWEDDDFDPTATVYLGDGAGRFNPVEGAAEVTGVTDGSASLGDLDGDGRLDLVLAGEGEDSTPTATVYLGEGNGTFSPAGAGLTGVTEASTSVGDLDGDGTPDLVLAGEDNNGDERTIVYLSDGAGGFSQANAGLTGLTRSSSSLGDLNESGNLDLVITGEDDDSDPRTIVYFGDGTGNFSEAGAELTGVQEGSTSLGDIDGDAVPDLVVTGNRSGDSFNPAETTTAYRNTTEGTGENFPPVAEPDSFETLEAEPLTVEAPGVLENDSDPDGDALSVSLVSGVSEGELTLGADGSVDYVPPEGFIGTEEFEYEVSDGTATDVATAKINVKSREAVPTGLTAFASSVEVRLSWDKGQGGSSETYNVYRSTSPLDDLLNASPINSSPVSPNSFADENVESNTRYYYRVTALGGSSGTESAPSKEVSVALPPEEVEAETQVSFGTAGKPDGYRLVATPGAESPNLGDVVPGEPGPKSDYRAFREEGATGSGNYTLEECGADCTLDPGTGVWLLHRENWSHQQTYASVDLSETGTYTIPLDPGWNLISNPFETDVAWSLVQEINGRGLGDGEDVGPIYVLRRSGWQTPSNLLSARDGKAFYFNNTAGLESLTLPDPDARDEAASGGDAAQARGETVEDSPAEMNGLVLRAYVEGSPKSRVELGLKESAETGLGPYDAESPPSPFGSPTLRSVAGTDTTARLLRDYRPAPEEAAQFSLELQGLSGQTVSIEPKETTRLDVEKILLVDRKSGRTFNLRDGKTPAIRPEGEAISLAVVAGDASDVRERIKELVPDEAKLFPTYPNPASPSEPVTIEYTVPEAGNVQIQIYDVLGRRVGTIKSGRQPAGFYRVRWQGGADLASGTYFVRLRSGSAARTRKITLVR